MTKPTTPNGSESTPTPSSKAVTEDLASSGRPTVTPSDPPPKQHRALTELRESGMFLTTAEASKAMKERESQERKEARERAEKAYREAMEQRRRLIREKT